MTPSPLLRTSVLAIACVASALPAFGQRNEPLSIQYQFPSSGATSISRTTTIIIRPGDYINSKTVNASLISVKGAFSGTHVGKFVLSDDKKTLVFTPTLAFTYSERVTVTLKTGIKTTTGKSVDGDSFYFTIQSKSNAGRRSIRLMPEIDPDLTVSTLNLPLLPTELPRAVTLSAVYPNPARSEANISYGLPETLPVQVVVYNSVGERVALVHDGILEAGPHKFDLDVSRLPNGVYHAVLNANGESRTATFVVAR